MLKFVLLACLLVAGHHGSPVPEDELQSNKAPVDPIKEAVASYQKQIEDAVQTALSAKAAERPSAAAARYYYSPYAYPVYSFGARSAPFNPFYFAPMRPFAPQPFISEPSPFVSARSPFPRPGMSDEEALAYLQDLKASQESEARFLTPTITKGTDGSVTLTFPAFTSVLSSLTSLIPTFTTGTLVFTKTTIGLAG